MTITIQFIKETSGSSGELRTTDTDSFEKKIRSYTEIPPSGLWALIAGVSGPKEALVVLSYDSDGNITGYADKRTREQVTLLDGPYKF